MHDNVCKAVVEGALWQDLRTLTLSAIDRGQDQLL